MTETQTPEPAVAEDAPQVSRRRMIIARTASIGTTVVLTVAANVAIGLASAKVEDLIVNRPKKV